MLALAEDGSKFRVLAEGKKTNQSQTRIKSCSNLRQREHNNSDFHLRGKEWEFGVSVSSLVMCKLRKVP